MPLGHDNRRFIKIAIAAADFPVTVFPCATW
jgi:hypothetical protein